MSIDANELGIQDQETIMMGRDPDEGDPLHSHTDWQAEPHQGEWHYTESGEWMRETQGEPEINHDNPLIVERDKMLNSQWEGDLTLHQEVLTKGYPNRWGAKIELQHRWNLNLLQDLLEDYPDREIVEWLRYGWPSGRLPTLPAPAQSFKNHKGAVDHPEALTSYIHKETSKGAVMGPFDNIPFLDKVGISPLSTTPKKNSLERRVILDLSFPLGSSFNDGMRKDDYMGCPAKLKFPKVDELGLRIF